MAPPLGRIGENDAALIRGFAVVTTDTGHKGSAFDASFMADQQASLDFADLAVGRIAVLARQIVTQDHGSPAAHATSLGRSTGGREGMLMTQRYPNVLRRRGRRCACHAYAPLRHRRRVGRDDAESCGTARCERETGHQPRAVGRRSASR